MGNDTSTTSKATNAGNTDNKKLVIIVYGREPTKSTHLTTMLAGRNYVEITPPPPWAAEQFQTVVDAVHSKIKAAIESRNGNCAYTGCVEYV